MILGKGCERKIEQPKKGLQEKQCVNGVKLTRNLANAWSMILKDHSCWHWLLNRKWPHLRRSVLQSISFGKMGFPRERLTQMLTVMVSLMLPHTLLSCGAIWEMKEERSLSALLCPNVRKEAWWTSSFQRPVWKSFLAGKQTQSKIIFLVSQFVHIPRFKELVCRCHPSHCLRSVYRSKVLTYATQYL